MQTFQSLLPVGACMSVWLIGEGVWSLHRPALAQVLSDRSFGTLVNGSQTDRCLAAVCTIEGGLRTHSGTTLLHSFEEFSLLSPAQSARFTNPAVDNILVRVTGGSNSFLNGAISTSASSNANLFFINSAGIQFGPGAQLNIGGSFVASTAQELIFDNGTILSATAATAPTSELLSISTPIGLGFLAAPERVASAPIAVEGPGHFLTFGSQAQPSAFVNREFQPGIGLSVPEGEAIKLFGNGIALSGGSLTAAGGDIELGSVSAGRILFDADRATDFSQVSQYADVSLTGRSLLEVSASEPGEALLRGQNIAITESSAILAESLPEPPPNLSPMPIPPNEPSGGLIDIQATGAVQLSNFDLGLMAPPFHSYLSVDVSPGATAPGGEIAIAANSLQVDAGGQLGANTYGQADAGRLDLTLSDSVILSGGSALGPSGVFATADVISSGKGGQIDIQTDRLIMSQGAQLFVNSFNQTSSGDISVSAEQVSLLGTGEFVLDPSAPPLVVPTLIQSGMGPFSQGQGGQIDIDATAVEVTDGAEISTGTFGGGDAGPLTITAQTLELSGFSPVAGPSALLTTVGPGAAGNGGLLTLETDQLSLSGGAQVATSTAGPGNAGDLFVQAGAVQLSGRTARGRSGLFATAVGDRGAGGNLLVEANQLTLDAGAAISVGNFPSGFPGNEAPPNSPFPPGQGAAGNLQVNADQITVRDESLLSAETVAGDRGNIRLQTDLLTLRRGSRITTNATGTATGGNIQIDATDYVVAVPEENSDITANAVFGDGGQVNISARQVLGLTARPALTAESDITASSEFGISGETRVENIDGEIRSAAEPLPQPTAVPDVLQGCAVGGSSSGRFVQSGQGGLASSPYGVLNRRRSLSDVSIPSTLAPLVSDATGDIRLDATEADESAADVLTDGPIEAQSWAVNAQGDVILTAAVADNSIGKCAS